MLFLCTGLFIHRPLLTETSSHYGQGKSLEFNGKHCVNNTKRLYSDSTLVLVAMHEVSYNDWPYRESTLCTARYTHC